MARPNASASRTRQCRQCHQQYACPCAQEEGPFQRYDTVGHFEKRLYENAEASVLEERANAIPRTTVAISIFFFCTGFQWVAHQLSHVPEECYDNPLCSPFDRLWNVKNWNGVLSSVSYELVGWFLLICYASRCCACCGCCPCDRCCPCAGRCCCDRASGSAARRRAAAAEEEEEAAEAAAAEGGGAGAAESAGGCCAASAAAAEEESPRATVSHGLRINACIAVISHGLLAGLYGACPTPTNQVFVYIGLTMVTNSFFLMEWCKRHPFALSAGSYAMFFAYVLVVITLDNVGRKGDQPGFEVAAWVLAFLGWTILLPRYFMLLHFGIPNLIPSMDEIEKMKKLAEEERRPSENEGSECLNRCDVMCRSLKAVDNCLGCSCFYPLYRVLRKVDMCMQILCFIAFLIGLFILIGCCYKSEPLSFVIMLESSWILLFYVTTCHLWFLCWPEKQEETEEPEEITKLLKEQSDEGDQLVVSPPPEPRVSWCFVKLMVGLTGAVFVAAVLFFVTDTFSTRKSRWESADMSRDCTLFGLFDHHDLWNLLSAVFLMLFILSSGKLDELHGWKHGLLLKVR